MKAQTLLNTKLILLALISLTIISCGGGEKPGIEVPQEVFTSRINQKPMPTSVNLNEDKTFLNREYPIEISLYEDGKWFYDLPNLGSGSGTYQYDQGRLKLVASRDLFDIYIELSSLDIEGSGFQISFRDRFGQNILDTELMR